MHVQAASFVQLGHDAHIGGVLLFHKCPPSFYIKDIFMSLDVS
jgi:hypothetical protein